MMEEEEEEEEEEESGGEGSERGIRAGRGKEEES